VELYGRSLLLLNPLHKQMMDIGNSRLTNKVAGIVVSGDSDGVQYL
jgi:hypothetical protein